MRVIPVIVSIETNIDQVAMFNHIVPIDLTKIFTGYGPLPAVIGTRHQSGAWDAAGQTRTVLLSDDSSAQEQLTGYDHPHYFSYTVNGFTGILRHLAISADGEWWFTQNAGKTIIRWRYAFHAQSALVVPILWFIAKGLWQGYMKKALSLAIGQLERP